MATPKGAYRFTIAKVALCLNFGVWYQNQRKLSKTKGWFVCLRLFDVNMAVRM